METFAPTHPATEIDSHLYYQVVHTLTNLLPPPLDDSPEALHARNHAAIAKVAALLPVDANEADLAAQCIAARAQAEDILRLLRQHAGDIALVMRLNAQYASMVRTSLSVHARLMRIQAQRHKRNAIGGAADQDAWTRHVVEQRMAAVVDPNSEPREATQPIQAYEPEKETNSHDVAFETWLSQQPWNLGSSGPAETHLRIIEAAMAEWRSACPEFPATGRDGPVSAGVQPEPASA